MAVVRLLAKPWDAVPSHRAGGLTASATVHTALLLVFVALPATPGDTPAATPTLASITVEAVESPFEATPDDTQDRQSPNDGSTSGRPVPLEDDGGFELDGLNVDLMKIVRQFDVLFPFVTESMRFLDDVRLGREGRPDQLVNPFGRERRPQDLKPLRLGDDEYDRLVNGAWSRRVRWQSFSEIAALLGKYDPDRGDAPSLVRSHLDHNLLQPYFDTDTRDPRYWVMLGLAADHEPFIRFVTSFAREHPSSRTTTELLFMLDEFAQGSRDAMLMLLDTDPETLLAGTRAADDEAFALAQLIDRRYRGWVQANGLDRGDAVRRRFDDVRLKILDAILASTPDGYGAGDARFLIGRIYWERRERARALDVWRHIEPDERDAYEEASTAITRELALADGPRSARISSILGAEYRRWLTYSAKRLGEFGYTFDTF